jgi:hypothetical protein
MEWTVPCDRARERVRRSGWKNVRVIDCEYGWTAVTRGEANAVLFSYSLSMLPAWRGALNCASGELETDGRIGIVDFCTAGESPLSPFFSEWVSWNHVDVRRRYRNELEGRFRTRLWTFHRVLGEAWCYFRYVGRRL